MRHPEVTGHDLVIIGRQVYLPGPKGARGRIDLLAIDANGVIWILELKLDETNTDVLAQAIAYGIAIQAFGIPWIEQHFARKRGAVLRDDFATRYGRPLVAEDASSPRVKIMVIAAAIDPITTTAIAELQRHDFPVEAVTFDRVDEQYEYEFTPAPVVPGTGPKRRRGSQTLMDDLDAVRSTTWIASDAVDLTVGQPANGGFAHRAPATIAGIDPLVLGSWTWFIANFTGRCVPMRFLYGQYRDAWSTRSHPASVKLLDPRLFGKELRKATAQTSGWAAIESLAPADIERERDRLVQLDQRWADVTVGSGWPGCVRIRVG